MKIFEKATVIFVLMTVPCVCKLFFSLNWDNISRKKVAVVALFCITKPRKKLELDLTKVQKRKGLH